ncbi:30S ribosomal protein S2 [Bacteroidales bacterium]|nr:30S ribosomal protein S2 [Bacteroidales bacterium]
MSQLNFDQLLEAGAHFGHLKRKWNPAMAPYIFMERNGIHIIDLYKTIAKADEAAAALKQIAKSGRRILFVATKKQAKETVADKASSVGMPYVTERWPGGMLTNFPTIRKAVKKMTIIDKMATDGTFDALSKREKLQITRQRAKLEKNLGSISDLNRLPSALFIIDVMKEHIAIAEANRLGIPVFAIVDTNSNPDKVDFVIPANDDASKSIEVIMTAMCDAIKEGLEERKVEKIDTNTNNEEETNAAPRRERKAKTLKKDTTINTQATATEEIVEASAPEVAPEATPEVAPEATTEATPEATTEVKTEEVEVKVDQEVKSDEAQA